MALTPSARASHTSLRANLTSQFTDTLASKKLAQLKDDTWLVDLDINFMLRWSAPKNAGEIEPGEHHDQSQDYGQDGQGAVAPSAIAMNLYYSILSSF